MLLVRDVQMYFRVQQPSMCSQADLAVKAARGQTAMTFALTNGCNAIVDILDKHQAILDAEEAWSVFLSYI